jgi:hypothetical protein
MLFISDVSVIATIGAHNTLGLRDQPTGCGLQRMLSANSLGKSSHTNCARFVSAVTGGRKRLAGVRFDEMKSRLICIKVALRVRGALVLTENDHP